MNAPMLQSLLQPLAKNWGFVLLRGVLAILFGIATLAWPGITLVLLIALYGAFALVDGVVALIAAIRGGPAAPRGWLAFVGLLGIAAGVVTFFYPGLTALILVYLIAGWAIATGVLQIIGAIRLRKEIPHEWFLVAGGVLSVLFGVVLFSRPGAGALAMTFLIGAYAIVFGVLFVVLAFKLKGHAGDSSSPHLHAPGTRA